MKNIKTLVDCTFGPRLYSFYKLLGHTVSSSTPPVLNRSHRYQPNSLESISDNVIRISKIVTSFGLYISPMLFTYLVYKRSVSGTLANSYDQNVILKLFATAISVLVGSFCIRGLGRYNNQDYLTFLKVLKDTRANPSVSNKRILVHFDADFSAYPVDFKCSDARDKRAPATYNKLFITQSGETSLMLDNFPLKWPLEVIISIVMKTVGRRLIYPGSLSFLQTLMNPAIEAGRSKLIEEHGGVRHKLKSHDGNHIDSMFIDRRGSTPNGDYLVIGCEGNGGFYEIGTILTPLEAGYSVLGWNHPGFGGSTGIPYPDQDVAAIDVVVKFAMDKLEFAPSQIIIYGWSIGGFTATWAGMHFPNIHGLVIDASFDHILPLARGTFPSFLYPFIEMAVKQHFDLDNSRHLKQYQGPILLIRRSQDEVIASDPYNSPPTNRANQLLIDLLKQRFPVLINDRAVAVLREYLGGNARYQEGVLKRYSVNNNTCLRLLLDHMNSNQKSYPINIGPDLDNVTRDQLVLFLASRFLIDYDSVHCAPLPARYFSRPWNLIGLAIGNGRL